MEKRLGCRDVGADCDFVACGKSDSRFLFGPLRNVIGLKFPAYWIFTIIGEISDGGPVSHLQEVTLLK